MKKTIQLGGLALCINDKYFLTDCKFKEGKLYHINEGYAGGQPYIYVKDDAGIYCRFTDTGFYKHFKMIEPTYNIPKNDDDEIKTNIYR